MNTIDRKRSTVVVTGVATVLALAALIFAAQAPEAIAASKWLSLPGFSMPAWLPAAFALSACVAAKISKAAVLMAANIAIGLSLATSTTALLHVL